MSEATSAAPAAPAASEAAPITPESANTAITQEAAPETQADEAITSEEEAELAAEEAAKTPTEEKPAVVKTKLKIDGKEVELTEDELKKYASLGKAAQKRMEEAAVVRKQHEKLQQDVNVFLDMLQKNPAKVLADLGVDPDKFAEDVINKKIAESAKTPEEKEKEELKKQLEDAQKKVKEIEEAKKAEQQERLNNEIASKIEKDINEAIESNDMPKHPAMIRKVADLLLLATSKNIDLEAKDVIPLAKKQIIEEFRELTGVLPEELLEEILGTDKVASLRRRYIKKMKTVPTSPRNITSTGQDVKASENKTKTPMKSSDFFKKIGSF